MTGETPTCEVIVGWGRHPDDVRYCGKVAVATYPCMDGGASYVRLAHSRQFHWRYLTPCYAGEEG